MLKNEVITSTEAAELTNISQVTIQQRLQRGALEGIKKGKVWLIDKQDLEKTED